MYSVYNSISNISCRLGRRLLISSILELLKHRMRIKPGLPERNAKAKRREPEMAHENGGTKYSENGI